MEVTSAILMVLGIYVGIPIVLVLAIGGVYALVPRLVSRAKSAKARKAIGALHPQPKAYEEIWDTGLDTEHFSRT